MSPASLQNPNIAAAVDADLAQLRLIFAIYRRYDKAIKPTGSTRR